MVHSRYNLITPLASGEFALFNPLSGAFDVVDTVLRDAFTDKKEVPEKYKQDLMDRGYVFNSAEDEEAYIQERYSDFRSESEKNELQFMFILDYACNFNCPYCYQHGVSRKVASFDPKILAAFVDFVKDRAAKKGKKAFVTLFGGEPLLPAKEHLDGVSLLIDLLNKAGLGLSIVTNGYYFREYLPVLMKAQIREIHFTLDGDKEIHDKRRSEGGKGSFDTVIRSMESAVEAGFPVNLRLITDRTSMPSFPELAKKLEAKGWFDLPPEKFKTSLGRNYELINDSGHPEELYTLDVMLADYVQLMGQSPILKRLHLPAFFGITQLVQNGEMYIPSFDTCPGAKSEMALDMTGKIYSCTASCGRDGYELGTYYPKTRFNSSALSQWTSRSILSIPVCKDCSVGVVCGGGCAVTAKEETGKILSPACKPVKEVMDIGIRFYEKELLQKAGV